MSTKIVVLSVIAIVIVGVLNYFLNRLIFKKSIVFKLISLLTVPILVCSIMGFFIGFLGYRHILWAGAVALVAVSVGNYLMSLYTQKPLEKILSKVDSLSQGDVAVSFDDVPQNGSDEISQTAHRLSRLTGSLKEIAVFADHIGKGNLDAEYHLLGDNDILGHAMLNMRSSLITSEEEKKFRQIEDEKYNWITVGLAKFAEILRRNNDNMAELSQDIISNLLKYINANQGGIFILNDDDPDYLVLELTACYAYERHKYLEKTIRPGEGLIGTCFLERETIYITKLPHDYIQITSGLGDDPPRALLIVPLKLNDEVYGMVEIASFKEFEKHEREFVEKVAESIAATISSVNVNLRTNKLLEISKIQAEEMASQEEELRQNMEEMQATQEDMRRRESELSETLGRMEALQRESKAKAQEMGQLYEAVLDSFNVIEFSPDGRITEVNQNVINMLVGATRESFLGKTLSDVSEVSSEMITRLWRNLEKGIPQENIQDIIVDGNKIEYKHKYIPLMDVTGALYKVILLAHRI